LDNVPNIMQGAWCYEHAVWLANGLL